AARTIPIVFAVAEDPVRHNLVASLARPGGDVTGINIFTTELVTKRLALLRELVPGAVRVAVLVNPAYPDTEHMVRDVVEAARAIGLQSQVFNASTSREINAAFTSLARERPDVLFVGGEFLEQSACPAGPPGVAPCSPCDICAARLRRGRWADELRTQH